MPNVPHSQPGGQPRGTDLEAKVDPDPARTTARLLDQPDTGGHCHMIRISGYRWLIGRLR
jgi:hypothetical protein